MAGFWREHITKRFNLSSEWAKARKDFISLPGNDRCAICGKKTSLQVHHKIPFSLAPGLELKGDNLVTLCGRCHLVFGHLGYFVSWNPNIDEDVETWAYKFKYRPTKKDSQEKITLWEKYLKFQREQIKNIKRALGLDLEL